ncbi:MAG: hypothetical protein ABI054_07715 [Planctomycetota bacterium]
MIKTLSRSLPLVLAAILTSMAISDGHRTGLDGTIAGARVSLAEVAAHSTDYIGSELRFTVQVDSQPEQWNPYLTRFGTEDFAALIVWADEQNLWQQEDYDSPAAMVFVRRGTSLEPIAAAAQRYARFEVTGIVRQVLVARPWIELTAMTPLHPQFTTGSMIHASRGVELMTSEHFDLAAQSFERALASDLPDRARVELERMRSESLEHSPAPIEPPAKKNRVWSPVTGASSSHKEG